MGEARVRLLLGIALLLVALRFVAVPWIQAQGEQRQRLQVLTQRLDRSLGVVGNGAAIGAAQRRLEADAATLRARFPEAADPEDFRLESQRAVGAVATRAGATLGLFDWLLDGEAAEARLAYGRVRIRFEGPLSKVILAHAELEASMPHAAVRELAVDLREPAAGPDETRAGATLVLDLYYRRPQAQQGGAALPGAPGATAAPGATPAALGSAP